MNSQIELLKVGDDMSDESEDDNGKIHIII